MLEQGALAGAMRWRRIWRARAVVAAGAKVALEASPAARLSSAAADIQASQAKAAVNSEDYREARQAFLEKRPPVFKGR